MDATRPHDVDRLRNVRTRMISAENPSGAPGGAGRVAPDGDDTFGSPLFKIAARELGIGWKVSPGVEIAVGETFELASIEGPARITHLFLATGADANRRSLILRAYWDDDPEPAVEVPLGDFFAQGTEVYAPVDSAMIAVNPRSGLNSYWPMPFRRSARITVENRGLRTAELFYQLTFEEGADVEGAGYLHAQFRRSSPTELETPHVLVEGIEGRGQYVGTYVVWAPKTDGWWGEGEVRFFLDDDREFPTIATNAVEDYFGGAWGFTNADMTGYQEFSTAYLGMPQVIRPDGYIRSQMRFGLYRWHVPDPIHFERRLARVEVQALGWQSGVRWVTFRDDIASTAFFYLDRTSAARPALPSPDAVQLNSGDRGAPPPSLPLEQEWPELGIDARRAPRATPPRVD